MATTYFLNMNGRTFGQVAPGASCMYGLDHLGSVVQTLDNNGLAQNQYRYHPYGTTESSSEPGPTSFYRWIGGERYRPTGRSYATFFMSRRHYGDPQASWTSLDLLWPGERAYAYCDGSPLVQIDPSGLQHRKGRPDPGNRISDGGDDNFDIYICRRPVIENVTDCEEEHWFIWIPGFGCNNFYGYGDQGVIEGYTANAFPASASPKGVTGGLGQVFGSRHHDVVCQPLSSGKKLARCLCSAIQVAKKKGVIGGCIWSGENYRWYGQNCQVFLEAIWHRCGGGNLPWSGLNPDPY